MSIENLIQDLTVAVNNLAAAVQYNTAVSRSLLQTPAVAPEQGPRDNDDATSLAREQGEANVAQAEEKPKRTRRKSLQVVVEQGTPEPVAHADQKPLPLVEAPEPEPEAEDGFDPFAPYEPELTFEQVRAAATQWRTTHSLAEGRELLRKFNVVALSELKPEQFAAFVAACK